MALLADILKEEVENRETLVDSSALVDPIFIHYCFRQSRFATTRVSRYP